MINVTVWNEHVQDKEDNVLAVYPDGINACIAGFLGKNDDINVTCATLDMPECGLNDEVLDNTDVLIWWGHVAHEKVPDEIVEKIHDRISEVWVLSFFIRVIFQRFYAKRSVQPVLLSGERVTENVFGISLLTILLLRA